MAYYDDSNDLEMNPEFQDTTNIGVKPTSAEYGTAYASAAGSAITSVLGGIAQTKAFKAQQEAETQRALTNIDNALSSYELNAYKLKEDFNTLDSMYADKVSERTLQGMKDFASMKAAAAETGTYGGSTDEAQMEAFVMEASDLAIINSQRTTALGGIARESEIAKQNAVNSFASFASGGTSYQANSLLSGLSAGVSSFGNLLTSMPSSVQLEIFGQETEGNKATAAETYTK